MANPACPAPMMMAVAVRFGLALTKVSELAISVLLVLLAELGLFQSSPVPTHPGSKLRQIPSRVIDPNQFEPHSPGSLVPTAMNGHSRSGQRLSARQRLMARPPWPAPITTVEVARTGPVPDGAMTAGQFTLTAIFVGFVTMS